MWVGFVRQNLPLLGGKGNGWRESRGAELFGKVRVEGRSRQNLNIVSNWEKPFVFER